MSMILLWLLLLESWLLCKKSMHWVLLSEMRAKFPLKSIAHWFKVHVANVAVLPMVQGRAKVTTTENPVTESRLFDTLVVKISCVIKILYIILIFKKINILVLVYIWMHMSTYFSVVNTIAFYYFTTTNLVMPLSEYLVFLFNFIYKRKRYPEGNSPFSFPRSEKDGNILAWWILCFKIQLRKIWTKVRSYS